MDREGLEIAVFVSGFSLGLLSGCMGGYEDEERDEGVGILDRSVGRIMRG